jgi:hypothetical protein
MVGVINKGCSCVILVTIFTAVIISSRRYTWQLVTNIKYYGCTQGRIYTRAKGARAQGGILKKIEIEVWYVRKKRLSTREKFKGYLYWKHHVLSFVSFLCCFCLHITEYEQIRGRGAQNFLGPRSVKYLNTGLVVLSLLVGLWFPPPPHQPPSQNA